ncbi:DoxX family protein [uncultured Azohydromonas sp.]|uniref:DoxX family protein n=1 Tax=uncultured Azohydromonas sp. TaxID=487342 RepID=UPI00261680A5|nr:DoxX family protein [uncultured Azohydromonas sp.]
MHYVNSPSQFPTTAPPGLAQRALEQGRLVRGLDHLSPVVDLVLRLFVAAVFFKSGLTKLASWDSTLALFENEYAVPLLPPALAALLGTGVELFFPVLLVLGLGTRLAAAVLFVFNVVAVISYPDLGAVGLKDHQTWGLMLLVTLTHGPGALSLDRLLGRRVWPGSDR